MAQQIITIVGGTGFVGRYVVRRLAAAGYTLRVISRHPDAALRLKTSGHVGQIVLESGDLSNPDSLTGKLEYSYAVINLAGILFEAGPQGFTTLHARGAGKLAQMAKAQGVQRFIHISGLGIDKATSSTYAHSKLMGEQAVATAFPEATILRPSVIFGPEDQFFNKFASMASISPVLPLIGGGHTRFQPVYVGDVARAVESCLMRPEAMGKIYELGGSRVYSFRQLMDYVLRATGRKRRLLSLPFSIASWIGRAEEFKHWASFGMFKPKLTCDQVRLLRYDSVVSPGALTFADLGISPTAIEIIVPEYLARFNKKAAIARSEGFKQWHG